MSQKHRELAADPKPFAPRDIALAGLLLVLLLIFYLPAIQGGLVFDDDRLITMPDLRSLHGLWSIWFAPPPKFSYYPLFHTVMWMECLLWGDSALAYHLANILQHAAAACLVVAVMRRLALPGAWLAAFIFALHPVNVESVAWISEQKNTLSTVFFLASLLAWLHFDDDRRMQWYLLASGLFLAAVLSKTTAATLPAALLVILWWRKGRLEWKQDVLPLLPWFAAGVALGLLSGRIEREGYDIQSSDFSLSLTQHCLLACRELWFYAGKLVWPVDLMFNYPRWQPDAAVWWQWLFPAGVLALVTGFCLLARRNRGPLAGFLFFAGNLFPVMGFFYVDWFMFSFVADHFQYVASLGIIVPTASALRLAAGKIHAAPRGAQVAAGVLIAALCSLTWSQCHMYSDMETFYQQMTHDNPDSGMAHYNYGLVLVKIPGRLTDAMDEMAEALLLRPDDVKLKDRIAFIFLHTPGHAQEAVTALEESLKLDPNDAYAHYLLGSAMAGAPGHVEEAIAHLEASVRLNPGEPQTHCTLGAALQAAGRTKEAITQYEEALRLNPGMEEAKSRLEQAQGGK